MNQLENGVRTLYFYHSMPLERVRHGIITPARDYSNEEYLFAYEWLEEQIKYYPLFLSVGNEDDENAVRTTGYDHQWQVSLGRESLPDGTSRKIKRKAGEFPNSVLFAFKLDVLPEVRCYNDYQVWHIVLMEAFSGDVGETVRKALFKRSWRQSKWLRVAARDGGALQVIVPHLNLDASSFIWVRNEKTRRKMVSLGFKNVVVKRVSCR